MREFWFLVWTALVGWMGWKAGHDEGESNGERRGFQAGREAERAEAEDRKRRGW